MPPGSVALETDPLKVSKLLAMTPQYRPTEGGDPHSYRPVASWQPAALVALGNLIDTPSAQLGVPFWEFPPIVFLGQLKSRAGVSRLVVVRFDAFVYFSDPTGKNSSYPAYLFTTTIIRRGWPGTIPEHPTSALVILDDGRTIHHGQDPSIRRLLFGTRCPTDPAAFNVDYQTDTGVGSFTIRLSDDGEKIGVADPKSPT